MIKRLTIYNIGDALVAQGFSRRAALALATFLDEDCRENEELDAVAIAGEWSEFESAVDWCKEYHGNAWKDELGLEKELGEEELEERVLDHVSEKTSLIVFDGVIIAQNY